MPKCDLSSGRVGSTALLLRLDEVWTNFITVKAFLGFGISEIGNWLEQEAAYLRTVTLCDVNECITCTDKDHIAGFDGICSTQHSLNGTADAIVAFTGSSDVRIDLIVCSFVAYCTRHRVSVNVAVCHSLEIPKSVDATLMLEYARITPVSSPGCLIPLQSL